MEMADATRSYRIAVDCMGGDKGANEVVMGAAKALHDIAPGDKLILVGKEKDLRALVQKAGLDGHPQIEILNADGVISMDDKPMQALKSKREASMLVALEMVKKGEVDAMFSTGNTKVLVGAGTVKLRPMEGTDRPALAAIMPHCSGHFVLMDVGANPESTPTHLAHNAIMGTIYAQAALGIARPRVGLLTVGTEEGKGNERIKLTHTILKKLDGEINYVGLVEGFDMFDGSLDVVVTDGFTGNVLLKTVEGMFSMLIGMIKKRIGWNPLYWLGALAMLPIMISIRRHLRPDRNGGAPLLGLSGLVMKAHGSSNRHAIRGAIRLGREALSHNMTACMGEALARANEILETAEEQP